MSFTRYLHELPDRLRDSRSEYAMVLAAACLVLIIADALALLVCNALAPELAAMLERVDRDLRVLAIGLPAALLFLATALVLHWRAVRGAKPRPLPGADDVIPR